MALSIRQTLKQSQKLLMTPHLQQAIKLLQMSRVELEEFIHQELQENPVLEELEKTPDDGSQDVKELSDEAIWEESVGSVIATLADSDTGSFDEMGKNEAEPLTQNDFVDIAQDPDYSRYDEGHIADSSRATLSEGYEDSVNYENFVAKGYVLADHLLAQIADAGFDDEEKYIAQMIIGNINDKGYFEGSLAELSESEGLPLDKFEGILDSIQRFDPVGVGSRSLRECLLVQIREKKLRDGIIEKIVDKHLEDVSSRNYNAIVRSLKVPLKSVIERVKVISELDPYPGNKFQGDRINYIVPDVYILKVGDEWVATTNSEDLPRLSINRYYQELEKHTNAKSAENNYLQEKIKAANWLIKSIHQRQATILKVTECILKKQRDFFERGVLFLKPMVLKDVADEIEMHESTVSRVTSNKFAHTPRGIFELKYFFSSSVGGIDGSHVTSESVKSQLLEIIKKEDAKKPFSDQQLVEMLEAEGVFLARRTVAKYREQVGILPSSKRRKVF